jgi:hypothetical protein
MTQLRRVNARPARARRACAPTECTSCYRRTKGENVDKKPVIIAYLAFALATPGVASAVGDANNTTPSSPGACQMFNANHMDGMFNDPHFADIMYPLVVASITAGCSLVK